MANDRSIISWDLVLKAKQKYEIKNMLIQNYKAMYGADINIDARTADAGWIDALTDMLYDFSLLAVNTYQSLDISNARGSLLDNLVLLSGNLVRHNEVPTKIQCQIKFGEDSDDNITISGNDIVTLTDIENKRWLVRPAVSTDSVIYFNGEYPGGGDQLVILEHYFAGAYFLPEGVNPFLEIRKNGTFITNQNLEVASKIMLQRGTFKETDSQLKARKKESLSYNSTSLVDSIRSVVLSNIYSIADIKIYNSVIDDLTDVNNPGITIPLYNGSSVVNVRVPLHDVFVLIKPAEGVGIVQNGTISNALVKLLQKKITLGISTMQANIDSNYHNVTIPVNSDYSTYTENYRYYVAREYKPYIKITGKYFANSGFNVEKVKERIINAVYKYAADYPINKNINKSELASIAFNAGNLDLLNPSFRIDSIDISIDSTITPGDNDVIVNNGYWFIDLTDELDEINNRLSFDFTEE